jgi:hypothetical protein
MIVVLLVVLVGNCIGAPEVVPPYGLGPTTNNIYQYTASTSNVLNTGAICSDTDLQLLCAYTTVNLFGQPFECWTYEAQSILRVTTAVAPVVYDTSLHRLIYGANISMTHIIL